MQTVTQTELMHVVGQIVKETKGSNNTIDKIYRAACRGIQGGKVSNSPAQVGCKLKNGVWV